jgi:hypothetical protein
MTIDPNNEQRRLQELYADMMDAELQKLASEGDSLTDEAWDVLEDELDRRGLTDKIEDSAQRSPQQLGFRELVTIREFRDLPEALLAQGLLQSAGIECSLGDANLSGWIGSIPT